MSYISIPGDETGSHGSLWSDETPTSLYCHPDVHDDSLFPPALAGMIDGVTNTEGRRAIIDRWLSHPDYVHGLPNHEALVSVIHPLSGFWSQMAAPGSNPAWVSCEDNPSLEQMIAAHYGCPIGVPAGLEDMYHTRYGSSDYPPGAAPDPLGGIVALHTNWGRDNQAAQQFGWGYLGAVGTATATTATTLTGSAETGVSHASNDCAGQWILAGPNSSGTGAVVYGYIVSNTSGTTPVYTVDRWYAAASPGGAAGTTPNATASYQVVSGGPPQLFVGLTANTTAPAATDTTLTGEITTASGGLIRKICPIGHTAGAATVTMTPVFTANGSDSLPVTIGKAGAGPSLTSGVNSGYQTLVSPTATLSASGDQLTLTWTFTMT